MAVALGVGVRAAADAADLAGVAARVLAEAGLTPAAVGVLATLDRRAGHPAVRALAGRHGWRLVALPAAALAAVPVATPSARVARLAGTPGVAEAAALLAAGPGAVLLVARRSAARATAALATAPATALATPAPGPGPGAAPAG